MKTPPIETILANFRASAARILVEEYQAAFGEKPKENWYNEITNEHLLALITNCPGPDAFFNACRQNCRRAFRAQHDLELSQGRN